MTTAHGVCRNCGRVGPIIYELMICERCWQEADRAPETRIVPCARCNGDGGWSVPVGIDYRDGSLIEREERCEACGGTGEEEVEVEPVTEEEMMACPVCGNEERGQGGYLTCQCPALRARAPAAGSAAP